MNKMNNNVEGFLIEINLRNKKKWLLSCSYNPKKVLTSNHLAELSKNIDLYINHERIEGLTTYQSFKYIRDLAIMFIL